MAKVEGTGRKPTRRPIVRFPHALESVGVAVGVLLIVGALNLLPLGPLSVVLLVASVAAIYGGGYHDGRRDVSIEILMRESHERDRRDDRGA